MWSVVSNGRLVGLFPEQQLVQWVASGQVDPNDLFWHDGMSTAAPAYTVAPFSTYFRATLATAPVAHQTRTLGDDAAMRWLLPVGRAPWAIAAGYLGLFSILGVFGPFAIVAGILGVRQIDHDPRLHGMGRAVFGIVAGAMATLVGFALIVSR
jgi:hypothetical protein